MTKTLTRRELYDAVWSKPVIKLEAEFGVSNVAIAKMCRRHRIPTPPRGYWAKIEAGKPVKKAIFVEFNDPVLNRIEFLRSTTDLSEPVRALVGRARVARKERRVRAMNVANAAPAPAPEQDMHPVARRTTAAFRKAKPDASGAVSAKGEGFCGVIVHKDGIDRAVGILSGLAKQLSAVGLDLAAAGEGLRVARDQDCVLVTLREETRSEKHLPTPDEIAAEERRQKRLEQYWSRPSGNRGPEVSHEKAYPDNDIIYTGRLILSADCWARGIRKKWADGKAQRLELILDDIATGIEIILAAKKADREDAERRERERRERARKDEIARQHLAREQKRMCFMNEVLEHARKADALRKWLATAPASEKDGLVYFSRFRQWAVAWLEYLEDLTSAKGMEEALVLCDLFPEMDDFQYCYTDWREKCLANQDNDSMAANRSGWS